MNENVFAWVMWVMCVVGAISYLVDFILELKKVIVLKHHECIDTDPILKLQLKTHKNCSLLDVIGFTAYLAITIFTLVKIITQTDMQWLAITCLILFTPIFVAHFFRIVLYNKMYEEQTRLISEMPVVDKATHRKPDKEN